MNKSDRPLKPATLCIHAGTYRDTRTGGVNSPIFVSTAFAYPNPANENVYPRYFNVANQKVIAEKVAALEQGEAGLVFGSGMAAITTLLFAWLKPGDHALFQADLYGGTYHFVATELAAFGVKTEFVPTVEGFKKAVRPNTRLIYVESPSNPLLRCLDLAAIADVARERGVLSIIDNTFATPINQLPLKLGIDVVVHSATKYLNGHSDLNAGIVVASASTIDRLREYAVNHGGMLDTIACAQLERGLKTLALRVREHNQNAARLAAFLQKHPAVGRVIYPGFADHPDHEVARRQMSGFGGMLSFEMRDPKQLDHVFRKFRLAAPALSLGGVETLVCIPSRTSHRTMSAAERQRAGISEGLVRVSVGIEDVEDLMADFDQAMGCG